MVRDKIKNMRVCSLMMDRNKVEGSIFAIDMRDKLGNLSLEFRRVRQGRRRHLDHDNVTDPLRVIAKELFESMELWNRPRLVRKL
jgi:hypothetical protein